MRIFSSFTPSTHPTISHPGGRKLGQVCKTLAISCGLAFMAYTGSTLGSHAYAADALPGKGITVKPVKYPVPEENFQHLLVMRALEQLG